MDSTQTDFLCPSPDIKYLAPANGIISRNGFINVSYAVDNLTINHYRDQSYIDGFDQSAYGIDIENASPGQFSEAYSKGMPYGKHTVSVRATNHGLLGSVTNSGKDHIVYLRPNHAPAAPSISTTTINNYPELSWSDVGGGVEGILDHYEIYRSETSSSGPWVQCGQAGDGFSNISWSDPSKRLDDGTAPYIKTVYYKIVAVDQHFSSTSNVLSFVIKDESHDGFL